MEIRELREVLSNLCDPYEESNQCKDTRIVKLKRLLLLILRDAQFSRAMHSVGGEVHFFVEAPPNFQNGPQVSRFLSFVRSLEAMPHSMGVNSTSLWFKPYLDHLSYASPDPIGDFYRFLPGWLADHTHWRTFLKLRPDAPVGPTMIDSFYFTTGFKDAVSWPTRGVYTTKWRAAADAFPDFHILYYQLNSYYVDQQLSIRAVTVTTVSIALGVMFLICLLFIPSLTSVLCASLALLSINLGVFGFLDLWNVDLDPISMITILMSVGFSVDFTCHISYHYYKSTVQEPQARLADALIAIGWPMFQAGFSTLVGISVLVIPQSYMSSVFVKTCFLVVFLGLVHGLVVLPVVLTSIPRCHIGGKDSHSDQEQPCPQPPDIRLCCTGASVTSSLRTIPSPTSSPAASEPERRRSSTALRAFLSLPLPLFPGHSGSLKPRKASRELSPPPSVRPLSHKALAPAKSL